MTIVIYNSTINNVTVNLTNNTNFYSLNTNLNVSGETFLNILSTKSNLYVSGNTILNNKIMSKRHRRIKRNYNTIIRSRLYRLLSYIT